MVNRAYDLVPTFGDKVDFLLGESVFTSYDFVAKNYHRVTPATYQHQVSLLRSFQKDFPKLRVMTLDYWNPDDTAVISEIYSVQANNGFSPYVAAIGLDQVVPRPEQP